MKAYITRRETFTPAQYLFGRLAFASTLLLGIALCSCNQNQEQKNAAISYEMKNFKVESPGGCASDTLACALYEVDYPVFSGLDSSVNDILRKKIDASVSMNNPEAEGETMQQIGQGFIEDFSDFKSEFGDSLMGWHYSATVAVEVMTDSLLSLSVAAEYFTGGAHGGYETYFINVRPSTGEEYTLSDYFKPGYDEPLRKAAESVFRKTQSLSDSASLAENSFEFKDDRFEFNDNYGFGKDGIVFFFNNYEIAAYAQGPTEVIVPYEVMKAWVR